MNKTVLRLGALIFAGSMFVGCGKDEDEEIKTNEPEFPTEYSELTVEQNKSKLEDNGISLVNEMTTFKNSSGIQASIAFGRHLDGSTLPDNVDGGRVASSGGVRLLQALASFGQNKSTPTKTLKSLRSATTTSEFESFEAQFNEIAGTYTYSKANDTWTYVAGEGEVVFKFPSTEAGTQNNAQYKVYGLESVTINSELGGAEYNGDYPTALKAELTIDNAVKMAYSFSAAYNTNGDPSEASISLTIDQYTLAYAAVNKTNEASFDYSLSNGSKLLFGYGARATGQFSTNAVNGSENAGDVVTSASAYFQIMNIKFSGEADINALADGMDTADTIEERLTLINDNYKLIVFYDDTKKLIAESEFYITEQEYIEYEWVYNPETGMYEEKERTVTEDVLDVRLVFADGTKSDLATYTDIGFEDVSNSLEEFADDIAND